jgi:hypothetical protein
MALASPSIADTPVSDTCTDDDIYKSVKTWYRDGNLLKQRPLGSEPIPALTEMVIVTDTEVELVVTLPDLDPGVTYEWGITLATGRHWETTTQDGVVVERKFGTCVVNY